MGDDQLTVLLGCETLDDPCMVNKQAKFVTFIEFVSLYRKNATLGKEQDANVR